ncbi:MAG: hypothetical protein JWO46_748 [Nocardioidaceae bacterium]|nr:hypothetical protein [Nocardioidaceae bacterium]
MRAMLSAVDLYGWDAVKEALAALGRSEAPATTHLCPECAQGKCRNCTGEAYDAVGDEFLECGCDRTVEGHP